MSNLLQHNNNTSNQKKIDKNVDVKTKTITRQDIGFSDIEKDIIPTFDVSVRLDNHSRNALMALAKTTAEKRTISEMLSIMIEDYTKKLNANTVSAYNEYLNALEEKDKLAYKLKNHK